jgi:hypothetical protein
MTHTCCANHKDELGFEEHFYSPQKDEIRIIANDLNVEIFDSDIHEIMDEEEEFIDLLNMACNDFGRPSKLSNEQKWINILARRTAFLEEGSRKKIELKGSPKPRDVKSQDIGPRERRLSRLEELKVYLLFLIHDSSILQSILINHRLKRASRS